MKAKLKRQVAIRTLILEGRTQEKVAEMLNVSISTVYRECRRMRKGGTQWIADLVEHDFAGTYKDALDGLQQDLEKLHDMLENPTIKNNPELEFQIRKQITVVREAHLKHLLSGPMVWSVEVFRKKYATSSSPRSPMKSLGGIEGIHA